MDGDIPLAVTGFNADVGHAVQVGGVYTPPDLRGRGNSSRAVGLHLARTRAAGRTRAVLFSGNPTAQRAYMRLGFEKIGAFAMASMQNEKVAHG
jgi:predicted GNAT family acetyltransferase